MPEEDLLSSAASLKAIAHPVRLRMIELLGRCGSDMCVCHFEEYFDLSQPTISHHLKVLRDAGLVESRRRGTWIHHSLRRDSLAALSHLFSTFGNEPSAVTSPAHAAPPH